VEAIQDWVTTHDSPWIFPGRGGEHLHPRSMQAAVRNLMETAGIKDIRRAVHSLRHTVGADLRKRRADTFLIWEDIDDVFQVTAPPPPAEPTIFAPLKIQPETPPPTAPTTPGPCCYSYADAATGA